MPETTPEKKAGPFEAAIDRLDEIVRLLESGDVGLDQSVELFREGRKLAATCETMLGEAQRAVDAAGANGGEAAGGTRGDGSLPFS